MNQLVTAQKAVQYSACFFFLLHHSSIMVKHLEKLKAKYSQELHNVQQGHAQTCQAPQKNGSPPE